MRRLVGKRCVLLAAAGLLLILLAGCAPGPNELAETPDEEGSVAGFWLGLWHGFIALFTFLISLFNENVRIYEVHNSGNLYNLGYILGIMMFFGGSGRAGKQKKR